MDTLIAAGLTNKGQIRQQNEDNWIADDEQGVFLVSDGMGGRVAGELASKIVVDVFPSFLLQRLKDIPHLFSPAAQEIVLAALSELSKMIHLESSKRPDFLGMGATVVLAIVRNAHALIAHIGDSRAYLFRDDLLEQLTKDHSLVQILVDLGQLKPEDVATHPARSQITQFVGMKGNVVPEVRVVELLPEDRLLLCSDGLTGMVADGSIAEILQTHADPETACQALIDAANAAGGKDNITVIVVDWHGHTVS
jgi:protein phosphatase